MVTEDIPLTKKAIRSVGADKVLTVREAIELVRAFCETTYSVPPTVEAIPSYLLPVGHRIWDSFRQDYPGFCDWLKKCQREHRPAFVIRSDSDDLAAVAIVNHEKDDIRGGKTLKIYSFKVHEACNGKRLGELLLKTIFKYCYENRYDSVYITTFPKHYQLLGLLTDLGFAEEPVLRTTGELQLSKQLANSCTKNATVCPLEYHIEFGPFAFNCECEKFIVPIVPAFHEKLFPELQEDQLLIPPIEGCANAIRKAYLGHSNTRLIGPGSLLLFYRSGGQSIIDCLGIVENIGFTFTGGNNVIGFTQNSVY